MRGLVPGQEHAAGKPVPGTQLAIPAKAGIQEGSRRRRESSFLRVPAADESLNVVIRMLC